MWDVFKPLEACRDLPDFPYSTPAEVPFWKFLHLSARRARQLCKQKDD